MATFNTILEYVASGTEYVISFDYLDEDHIYVTNNGEPVGFAVVASNVVLDAAPEPGVVRVQRDTPNASSVVWAQGSTYRRSDKLNEAFTQDQFNFEESADEVTMLGLQLANRLLSSQTADQSFIGTNNSAYLLDRNVASQCDLIVKYGNNLTTTTNYTLWFDTYNKLTYIVFEFSIAAQVVEIEFQATGANLGLGGDGLGQAEWTRYAFDSPIDFNSGVTTQLTLPEDPGDGLVLTFDGVVQHEDTYNVAGTVITFVEPITEYVQQVEVRWVQLTGIHLIDLTEEWVGLLNGWNSTPIKLGNIATGEVYQYNYSFGTRYRLVPIPYDPTLDAFYSGFVGSILTGFIVARAF